MSKLNYKEGAIGILLMTAIALLTVTIAIGTTAVSFNQLISYGDIPDAHKALAYAESGARDALLRISRDYATTTSATTNCGTLSHCYLLDMAPSGCVSPAFTGCARVQIANSPLTDFCLSSQSQRTIAVESQVGTFVRIIKVTVTLSTNPNYLNMIKDTCWQEATEPLPPLPPPPPGPPGGV